MAEHRPDFGDFEDYDPEQERREVEGKWGPDWNDSDFEDDPESVAATPKEPEKPGFKPQTDFGLSALGLGKVVDISKEQLQKRRKVTIKITNESSAKLIEPQMDFQDGKAEKHPAITIASGEMGEAVFKGRTLKGCLSYEIVKPQPSADSEKYRLVIVFKVLLVRGFDLPRGKRIRPNRENQAGIEVVKDSEISLNDDSTAIVKKYRSALKHSGRRPHTYPDSDTTRDANRPPLIFRYNISDTGEAEVTATIQNDSAPTQATCRTTRV